MPGTVLDNLATSVNNLNKVLILVAIIFYWVEINDKQRSYLKKWYYTAISTITKIKENIILNDSRGALI